MRKLKHIWQWIRRELFFDFNRVYKGDFHRPPHNRHERRRQAKEDRCWFSTFWKDVPIYRWREYRGVFARLKYQEKNELKRKIQNEKNLLVTPD